MRTPFSQIPNLTVHDSVAHTDAQSKHYKDPFVFAGIEMSPSVLLIVQRIFGPVEACEIGGACVNALQPNYLHRSFSRPVDCAILHIFEHSVVVKCQEI